MSVLCSQHGAVLELNCSSLELCCLREFRARRHNCFIWDEAHPFLIARNRMLFHAPTCLIDMSHSPTGQPVLKLCVNDDCSIILTNSWNEDLETQAEAFVRWIQACTLVLIVGPKLYIE